MIVECRVYGWEDKNLKYDNHQELWNIWEFTLLAVKLACQNFHGHENPESETEDSLLITTVKMHRVNPVFKSPAQNHKEHFINMLICN